jgi:hypothetical protein
MAATRAAIGSQTSPNVTANGKKIRAELKAVRLTASVVGTCIVLWTPYVVGRLIQFEGTHMLLGQYVADIGNALIILNSSLNWIVYGLASNDFRRAVRKMLRMDRHVATVVPTSTSGKAVNVQF